MKGQYVCLVCGFNMIGHHPDNCPFCNAPKEKFITSAECSESFIVKSTPVTDNVTCLRSEPELGLEHSAYCVEAVGRSFWIDCPSSFTPGLGAPRSILFTHHHFLGASNLYREEDGAKVYIHRADSEHDIVKHHDFDTLFEGDFKAGGLEAYHINGHTPGFTFYIHGEVLFICDYLFQREDKLVYNPYGPKEKTEEGGRMIARIIKGRDITMVCGFNYFERYKTWRKKFDRLLAETV